MPHDQWAAVFSLGRAGESGRAGVEDKLVGIRKVQRMVFFLMARNRCVEVQKPESLSTGGWLGI
jgi:hypothetical protein